MCKRILIFSSIVIFFGFVGCTIQGYKGPASEVATIYYQQVGRVSLKNSSIDNVNGGNFKYGFEVKPGDHAGQTEYQLAMSECPMFSVGCVDNVILGSCNIKLTNLMPGQTYTIEIKSSEKDALVRVFDQDTETLAGSGICTPNKEAIHGSVIRRRSTIGQ